MSMFEAIEAGPGYYLGQRLSPLELETVRAWITAQYLDHLRSLDPTLVGEAARLGIENYHLLQHNFDHGTAWSKQTRILPTEHVAALTGMGFYRAIADEFIDVAISDDELNWRLVRPQAEEDVGPVHADGWFLGTRLRSDSGRLGSVQGLDSDLHRAGLQWSVSETVFTPPTRLAASR